MVAKIARDVFGLSVPDFTNWRTGNETVALQGPRQLGMDVSLVGTSDENWECAIIHEVQNSCAQKDLDRIKFSWPTYLTNVGYRLRCEVMLLVFCPDEATARAVEAVFKAPHRGFTMHVYTYWPGKLP